jgi:rfaE bifunctional protein kinase chain/domain
MPGIDYPKLFDQFNRMKIMVIGDVMIDAYIFGKVERISPEAPVPVVLVEENVNRLGGAANVALNLKALGAEPVLCAVIGSDPKGEEFLRLLAKANISGEAVINSHDRITTTKSRIFGYKTQMLRVDEEVTHDLSTIDQEKLMGKISSIISSTKIDAIIVQDYNKGVLSAGMIRHIIEKAEKSGVPVAVDPKKKNFLAYKNVSLFKPNLKELHEGLGKEFPGDELSALEKAASYLHKETGAETVMTTLSEKGVFISHRQTGGSEIQQLIPAHVRKISDVSGAGDTVISVAALGLACGLKPGVMASLANLAGGLVCEEIGVVPINRERLLAEAISLL